MCFVKFVKVYQHDRNIDFDIPAIEDYHHKVDIGASISKLGYINALTFIELISLLGKLGKKLNTKNVMSVLSYKARKA